MTVAEPEFTDTARAALLWVLWHHQGGSSPTGQAIRFALGMGQFDRLRPDQVAQAKAWAPGIPGLAHTDPAGVAAAPARGAFIDPALLAKAVMTPEQEDTVRRGCCPKCMERTLGEATEGGGVAFRQCSPCTTVYALGVQEVPRG